VRYVERMFGRTAALLGLGLTLLALAVTATSTAAPGSTREETAIVSADGAKLAATLTLPPGTTPAGGWPALVLMHGLGGTRAQGLAIAQAMGVGDRYAVLAFDARGHGASEGLVGLDGPNEIADVRAVFAWLRDRPDVSDTRIGAFGVSYGGGAAWNSLVAGVPWAAVATCITFTDLAGSLYPQQLARTGVIAGFVSSLDQTRLDPALTAARDAAFKGDTATVAAFSAARSSLAALKGVRTPVFVMHGRRDFAFGLDQALPAWSALAGPKKLWIGNIGHVTATSQGPDTPAMLAEGARWFDRFLADPAGSPPAPSVTIAAEGTSRTVSSPALPATRQEVASSAAAKTVTTSAGKAMWSFPATTKAVEVFGAPVVKTTVTATGGWSRVVAVLTAVNGRRSKVVSVGGVPVKPGTGTYAIRLISQATLIPRGWRLVLTLASSTASAPAPVTPVYLDLALPDTARLSVSSVAYTLPVLTQPVSGGA